MIKSCQHIVATSLVLLIAGCVAPPPDVSAELPLIENANVYSDRFVSTDIAEKLKTAQQGDEFDTESHRVRVGAQFISALGLTCKGLSLSHKASSNNQERSQSDSAATTFIKIEARDTVACTEKGEKWFVVRPLMANKSIGGQW